MPHPNLQDVQIGRPVFLFFMTAVRQRGAAFFARIGGLFFIVRGGCLVIRYVFRPGGAFFFIFAGNVVNGKVRFRPGRPYRPLRRGASAARRRGVLSARGCRKRQTEGRGREAPPADAAFFSQEAAGDRSRKGKGERPPTQRSFREKLSKRQADGRSESCCRHRLWSTRRFGPRERVRPPPSAAIVAAIWFTGTGPPAAIGCARDRGQKSTAAAFAAAACRFVFRLRGALTARSGHERRRWSRW